MNPALLVAAGVALFAWMKTKGTISAPAPNTSGETGLQTVQGANGQPVTTFNGVPVGTVTLGGSPPPAGWSAGNLHTATQAAGLVATGATAIMGIGSAVGQTAAGGALAAGTTAGAAIPLVGIGVAIVGAVLGIISAHHAAAVAKEANSLNATVPAILQRFVLIIQAAIAGEIKDMAHVNQLVDQGVSDYYAQNRGIIQGIWHYSENAAGGNSSPAKPSTCNGPCTVGHYYVETAGYSARKICALVLSGRHGKAVVSGQIPSHAGFSGFPEIDIVY